MRPEGSCASGARTSLATNLKSSEESPGRNCQQSSNQLNPLSQKRNVFWKKSSVFSKKYLVFQKNPDSKKKSNVLNRWKQIIPHQQTEDNRSLNSLALTSPEEHLIPP